MNRIDRVLAETSAEGRAALILFITAADPDIATTADLIPELFAAGADIIEIGVPHSDPIAEGPTIQGASFRSLEQGTNLDQVLELCRSAREVSDAPLILMGYLNNVLARGEERFARDCAAAQVDGLIVADAPYEEAPALQSACDAQSVHRILMVAPTSTPERTVQISARSRGFVYCVSTTGVTGERAELPSDLSLLVGRINRVTATPVCVGFGISTPEHAAAVGRLADGVIVGSALVSRIGAATSRSAVVSAATEFVSGLAAALH